MTGLAELSNGSYLANSRQRPNQDFVIGDKRFFDMCLVILGNFSICASVVRKQSKVESIESVLTTCVGSTK